MPKVDRCAQLKKETQVARKRFTTELRAAEKAAEKEKQELAQAAEERAAEERQKAKEAAASRFERAIKAGQANSTFAKATSLAAREEDHEPPEEAEDEDSRVLSDPKRLASGLKDSNGKETNASKKRQQAARHADEMRLLAEEQKAAMRHRVITRFLRVLVVGFFVEAYKERDRQPAPKDAKPKKKGGRSASDGEGWSFQQVREKANTFGGPFLMLLFVCFIFGARIAGEDYVPDRRVDDGVNFYEVLGIASDADVLTLRKAYKALALSWHPDKNPGCEACAARFAKISEAYETLNNPEKKKAYDQRRAPEGTLESVASSDLTAEDFEARVARSNEVWFVQVYDSTDGLCQSFHPVWEDVAQSHQHLARFGRLDASKQRRALGLLPQRVVAMPLVFRFARGLPPEIFQWSWSGEERGSGPLARFVADNFPTVHRLTDASELRSWWAGAASKPRLLLTSPAGPLRGGARASEFMQVQRTTHMWSEFIDSAASDSKLVADALGQGLAQGGSAWVVSLRFGDHVETKQAKLLSDVPNTMQELIGRAMATQVPLISVRNHQQLCGAHGMRTFCLVLVDAPGGSRVSAALEQLNASRATFAQEALELKSAEGEAPEELFHIQPVRLMTSSSRLPWHPVSAGPAFGALWADVEQAPAFVLELETRRVAAVRTPSYRELFQQIAYDDLKFHDLPEGLALARSFPDPEVSLRKVLIQGLSSLPGSTLALLLAAVGIAVVPELSLLTSGASLAAVVSVLLACWPAVCRRFIAIFWCAAAPSRFECQVGG